MFFEELTRWSILTLLLPFWEAPTFRNRQLNISFKSTLAPDLKREGSLEEGTSGSNLKVTLDT